MFRIDDLLVGKEGNGYGMTHECCLCRVIEVYSNVRCDDIRVQIVGYERENELLNCYDVRSDKFLPITYGEFKANFPNHYYAEEILSEIKEEKENTTMETKMNKEVQYVLTEEERETLRAEIIELLEEYDYNPTTEGVDKILDEWVKNKGWVIELFKKHPNYNGRFQIAFDSDYNREVNQDTLEWFADIMRDFATTLKKETKLGGFTYSEVEEILSRVSAANDRIRNLVANGHTVTIDGMTPVEYKREYSRWLSKYSAYMEARDRGEIVIKNIHAYTAESYTNYVNFLEVSKKVACYKEHIVDEDLANYINAMYPTVKAKAGQKMSRLINKICLLVGMDKWAAIDYNRYFAKYSDAINPLAIKRHTILSVHPVDYYTMSFGNSWASCHTIDKTNKRDMPNDYHGCYSSGTESYMLDESTFVFYTVDKSYDGNEYELQPKINRNMFHMGNDKLIQGRVYPQATDGAVGIYKQIREIAQKVISDCLEVPNMWKNVKGTSECGKMVRSEGTHYKDYVNFSDCNVSYLKGTDDAINKEIITVGHTPICPNCGHTHNEEESIECGGCFNDEVRCACCGEYHHRDNMHEIDGDWYCEDCCFYCEYCNEWETGDSIYVENYGTVCDYGVEYGDFFSCEHCGGYYHMDSLIHTEDDAWFCSRRCAERDGYVELDEAWYPESEIHTCGHCGQVVHEDNWIDELECCADCKNEVREIRESEEN